MVFLIIFLALFASAIPAVVVIILFANPSYFLFPYYKSIDLIAGYHLSRGNYTLAIRTLFFGESISYFGPKLCMKAAKIYYDYLNDYEKCSEICNGLISKNSVLQEAYFYNGRALENLDKKDEAIRNYLKSEEKFPHNSIINYRLAWLYDETGIPAWRDYYLNRALRCIDGKTADMYNFYGNILFEKSDYENAIKEYMNGITECNESRGSLYLNIANAYRMIENFSEAHHFLHRAAEFIPDNVDLMFGMSEYYRVVGDTITASEWINKIKSTNISPDYRCMKDGVYMHNVEYFNR